ncbi:MAG: peptide ABC transporter substrate-binding protein [Lachnospiraceae bacterium]|nr:peptide ABC transporter substrate-binding protein [Lachnospiraceae bacterium]
MKKKVVSLLLAAAMVMSLAACGGSAAAPAATDAGETAATDEAAPAADAGEAAEPAEATVTDGDTNILRINLASEPDYLDPALNSSVDGGCLAVNTFAGLYTYDENGKLIPDLAEAMPEISADGTTYTVKMIDSVWSNGDPLTAEDIVYSWNRVIDEKTAADYAYLFDVFVAKSDGTLAIDTPDDHTLVIQLQAPCPYFTDLMAFPTFFPVHRASVEAADPTGEVPGKWAQEAGFVCNGAYTLQEWNHDESMVYVKNPNYHAADTVTMDELHFMLSADDTAIYAAYNSGDVDYIDTVPNDEIASLNGINPEFGILPNIGTYYVCFNVNDPMFDGKTEEEAANMRKAMSYLIDRQFIVDNIGQTGQEAADAFIPSGMADGNGGEFKTKSYYDVTKTGADMLEESKALLESAGYTFTDNGDGSYAIDPAINMTYLTNDGTGHVKIAEAIQQDFDLLGIQIEIKTEDWNVFLEDRKNGNFTVAREGWLADYNDPINMLEIFASESGNNDAQLGKGKAVSSSPKWDEYDKMINEIRYDTDLAKRVETMHKAEDMLMDTGAIIPLYYYNDVYMQKSNVSGIYATVFGMKYFMHATKN